MVNAGDRVVRRMLLTLLAVATGVATFPADALAQAGLRDRLSNPVQFTGEVGSLGELYSISGGEQRRPSSTGRLFLRSRLELFGTVSVNLDLLYSTESSSDVMLGSSGRQSLNQIGIAPEWSWGRGYLGTFSDSYSSLTFDGMRLRGAGMNINPGPLRLAAFTGRSQSAVPGGAVDGAYQRSMAGGRIGYGRRNEGGQEGAFIDLVFLRTADDPSSLPPAGSVDGSAGGDAAVNAYAVTPEENVVAAAVTRVPVWNDQLIVTGEVAASLHSRDRRAPVLTDEALDEYVGLLRSFITPRASTYGDMAHKAQIELRRLTLPGSTTESPRSLTAALGYRYIGAGYVSLGLASLPADQRAIDGRVAVRFRAWNASLQGMRQNDNLLGQKLATSTRNRLAATASFRPSRVMSSSLRAAISTVGSDADDAARRVDFTSVTLGATQTFMFAQRRFPRALALSYGYQEAGDASSLRAASSIRAHDISLRSTLEVASRMSLVPAVGLAFSNVGDAGWDLRHTYSLAGQYRASGGRWSSSASLSNSRLHAGGAIQAALSSRYRVTDSDLLTVSARTNRVSGLETAAGGFHEHTLSVRWERSIR
ncbi:MAG TPA: hypothetical protein VK933_18235 [Longimicrobiales bacterium]|nr:hypothetical protein [Longimicrobiales bacterium]